MSKTLAQAEHDALWYGRLHAQALSDHNHPDHAVVSQEWAALNRHVVELRGVNPDAPSGDTVGAITGGYIGGNGGGQ
ncbi:MAG: hypothetical protein AB1430_17295 [Pseudomonadota bacterium]